MSNNGNGHHGNGKSNGHDPAKGDGVGTPQVIEDLGSRRHKRETYQLLQRAIRDGYDMPDGTIKAAVATAIRDMSDDAGSTRARAREFLLAVRKYSVDAAVALDKIERLDAGEDTERVGVRRLELEFDRSG